MNIRRQEPTLLEADQYGSLKEKDLKDFLANFPDNAKSWGDATGELTEMHKWLAEECGGQFEAAPNPKQDPGVNNKFHKAAIMKWFHKLDTAKKSAFFEKYGQWLVSPLFESDTSMDNKQEKAIDAVLDTRSKQFQFEDGGAMANMLSDVDGPFGLLWHDAKTKDFAGFAESVRDFLSAADQGLSASDVDRLKVHYDKYNWRTKLNKN